MRPLRFDAIGTLSVCNNVSDLYSTVLVDTPLAPYFESCMSEEDLNEVNIEIIRNKLWKVRRPVGAAPRITSHTTQAYLEDFYHFTQKLGGATAEVMKDILQFEADRRTINITINSIGTELQKEDRGTLYPNFGMLSPEGTEKLMKADDQEQVKSILENYQVLNLAFARACG